MPSEVYECFNIADLKEAKALLEEFRTKHCR